MTRPWRRWEHTPRTCERAECERVYIPERPAQRFCSRQCSTKMTAGCRRATAEAPRTGRPKGCITEKTRRWAKIIRRMRAEKKTLQQIADRLGTSKVNVWRICKVVGIASPRDYGTKRYLDHYVPPPIDPEKARQITESKKKFWSAA